VVLTLCDIGQKKGIAMNIYKILIIDDEESVLNALTRLLREENYDITTCETAERAEEILADKSISLIICDYRLKGMNGIDFLERIKKENPEIATIMLTGHAEVSTVVEAVNRLSLQGFIIKPWDNEEVKQTVKNALKHLGGRTLIQVKAKDIMSKFAITVEENASLTEAAHLLMRFKISGMPVVSESGDLVGVITATDLFNIMGKTADDFSLPEDLSNVKKVMTKDVLTIDTEVTLLDIIHIMHDKNIHTLPVVGDGEIKGVVGRRDVFNKYYKLISGIKD
jgi:CBS domain-containing protein